MWSLKLFLEFALLLAGLGQEKTPAPQAPPAPGVEQAPPGGGGGVGGGFGLLFPLLLCFAVFWFIVILPERRKQKARQAIIRNVKKGDQVVTTSGILGKVLKVEDREVVLQVDRDSDVRMRFLKSAVHEVIPEAQEGSFPPKQGQS